MMVRVRSARRVSRGVAMVALLAGCVLMTACSTSSEPSTPAVPPPRVDTSRDVALTQCEGAMDLPQRPQEAGGGKVVSAEPPSLTTLKTEAPYRQLDKSGDSARLAMVRQSALSLGMRAGFNRGIWCRQQEIQRRTAALDRIYDFRALLFDAGGGFMYEPGIVTEVFDARKINSTGTRAASAAARIAMSPAEKERLVTRARDWRQYLIVETEPLAPQAPEARPLPEDASQWQGWVAEGWRRGLRQANDTMDDLWNRLDKDYLGMIAYRRMMLEGKIAPPRTVVTDRGVTSDAVTSPDPAKVRPASEMRIGDVQVETRRAGQLRPDPAQWHPLPFISPPAGNDTGGAR